MLSNSSFNFKSARTQVSLEGAHNDDQTFLPVRSTHPRNFNSLLRLYIVTDSIALVAGFFCAWMLADTFNTLFLDRPVLSGAYFGSQRLAQSGVIAAAIVFWFGHMGHYRMRMPFWTETKKIVSTLALAMTVDGFLEFASKQDFSRMWLISSWLISAGLIIGLRSVLRGMLKKSGHFRVRTLLIGTGETAKHTLAALKSESGFGYEVSAQMKDLPSAFMRAGKSWGKIYASYEVDHVIIALDGHELATAERPLAQLAREALSFSVCPPLHPLPVFGMVPHYFFNHDVMMMTRSSGLEQPLHCFAKRMVDIMVSGVALALLSPVMLVIALLVKCDGGPAFFGHSRIGRDGKLFPCMKFRSMVMNGDKVLKDYLAAHPEARKEWDATRKLQNDPRVTRLGKFLRKSSLDELPQLLNVLRGDMSLVGPRPIVNAEIINYEGDIAHYYRVRPGITGLWQVSGRSDVSYSQRVHMDSWYVRNWSLWHDIAIMFKTVPALMQRRGAY